ncbi:GAF domain-containing protein [Halobacillus sp. K22]|uniref:GAF domain-containing protein n=1 Tax=Halobacillus sp. K22 TaxID=3457431 RepID=UPI003FCDB450
MGTPLEEICNELEKEVDASVIAIAEFNYHSKQIQWKYVNHPLNDKHKRMIISYGSGVAGSVMQTGRTFLCRSRKDLPLVLSKYPIVLAEKLQSFAAIPLQTGHIFDAVLLIGYRDEHELPLEQQWRPYAARICNYLKQGGLS